MKFVITIRWRVGVGWVAHVRGVEYKNLSMRQVRRLKCWALAHGAKRCMKHGFLGNDVEILYKNCTAQTARKAA